MRKAASFGAILFLGATAFAADFTGTWKMNLDKSPGPHPQIASETITLDQIGPNAYRTTIDTVLKSGVKVHHVVDRVYDGQEHHVLSDGKSSSGTEICEITDPGVRKITFKENGKVVRTIRATISPDGKTMTHTVSSDEGEYVRVYEKQ